MDAKKGIGSRIKTLRKKAGLSQEEAAELAGLTSKHLSSIELGKENPTLDTFLRLANVFDLELWELLNYGHELDKKELQSKISRVLKGAKQGDLQLMLKFMNIIMK